MLKILNNIYEGKSKEGDIEVLEDLAEVVQKTVLCVLGQTVPNPVLSTIRYFRDEYEDAIKNKKAVSKINL